MADITDKVSAALSDKDTMSYRVEHMYFSAICDANQSPDTQAVTYTEAARMHGAWHDALKRAQRLSDPSRQDGLTYAYSVLHARNPHERDRALSSLFARSLTECDLGDGRTLAGRLGADDAGAAASLAYDALADFDKTLFPDDEKTPSYLLVSPFDPDFSQRSCAIEAGMAEMAVDTADLNSVNLRPVAGRSGANVLRASVIRGRDVRVNIRYTDTHAVVPTAEHLGDVADLCGLSDLRLVVRPEQYERVRDQVRGAWADEFARVQSIADVSELNQAWHELDARMRNNREIMRDQIVPVICGLSDRGHELSLSVSDRPGQVECSVVGTPVTFRAMETPRVSQDVESDARMRRVYMGRVRAGGRIRAHLDVKRDNGMPAYGGNPSYDGFNLADPTAHYTADDKLNMVLYLIGEPVADSDGASLGTNGHVMDRRGKRVSNTYWTSGRAATRVVDGRAEPIVVEGAYTKDGAGNLKRAEAPVKVKATAPQRNVFLRLFKARNKYAEQHGLASESDFAVQIVVEDDYRASADSDLGVSGRATPEQCESLLRDYVDAARASVERALGADELIELSRGWQEGDALPDLYSTLTDDDTALAGVRRDYWDVLVGRRATLTVPSFEGVFDEQQRERNRAAGVVGDSYDAETLTPEQIVRAHARDYVERMVGTFDMHEDSYMGTGFASRFNPETVAAHMSAFGGAGAADDLIGACRGARIDWRELSGDTSYARQLKDRLEPYKPEQARSLAELAAIEHPDAREAFARDTLQAVADGLRANACVVDDADITVDMGSPDGLDVDAGGLIRYRAHRIVGHDEDARLFDEAGAPIYTDADTVTGELGRIPWPTEAGTFAFVPPASDPFEVMPQTRAWVLSPARHAGTLCERTRGSELTEDWLDHVRATVMADTSGVYRRGETSFGDTYSLGRMWATAPNAQRLPYNDRVLRELAGRDADEVAAVAASERGRVVFSAEYGEGASIMTKQRDPHGVHALDDRAPTPWAFADGQDMTTPRDEERALYDERLLPSDKNQTTHRYLNQGARLSRDHAPVFTDTSARSALSDTDLMRFSDFDPANRQQMASSNARHALRTTEPVGVAMCSFGGLEQDDGIVVSKEFAETYTVMSPSGERPLRVGDKLSDAHGNKGCISAVIDRDMDPDSPECKYPEVTRIFRDNPSLSCGMSPASFLSRRNAGTGREAICRNRELGYGDASVDQSAFNLKVGDDVVAGGIGHIRFMVHDKLVDKQTNFNNNANVGWQMKAGLVDMPYARGRAFGANERAFRHIRESLRTSLGCDMDADGTLRTHLVAHVGETRRDMTPGDVRTKSGALSVRDMKRAFLASADVAGGTLKVPFPLTWPERTVDAAGKRAFADGVRVSKTDQGTSVAVGGATIPALGETTPEGCDLYEMPVEAASERASAIAGGTSRRHDHTSAYGRIMAESVRYREYARRAAERPDACEGGKTMAECMQACADRAQRAFAGIANETFERVFTGNDNDIKTRMCKAPMPNSTNAVWTSDPTLHMDTVAIGPEQADKLGLKRDGDGRFIDGQTVVLWRSPVLLPTNIMTMRARVDENLFGAAVNPAIASRIAGDFDGDKVSLWAPKTPNEIREAKQMRSLASGLLDMRHTPDVAADGSPRRGLEVNLGMDAKYGIVANPLYGDIIESASDLANRAQNAYADGTLAEIAHKRERGERMGADEARACCMPRVGVDYGGFALADMDDDYIEANMDMPLGASAEDIRDAMSERAVNLMNYALCGDGRDTVGAMRAGVGQGVISYADEQSHMQSILDANVNSRVKGKAEQLDKYMEFYGCKGDVELDEDTGSWRVKVTEVADHTLRSDDDMRSSFMAVGLKSYETGTVGAFMQKWLTVCSDEHDACTVAQPPYQWCLDIKHDGELGERQLPFINVMRRVMDGASFDWSGCAGDATRLPRQLHGEGMDARRWPAEMQHVLSELGQDVDVSVLERVSADVFGEASGVAARARESNDHSLLKCAFDTSGDSLLRLVATESPLIDAADADYAPNTVREHNGWFVPTAHPGIDAEAEAEAASASAERTVTGERERARAAEALPKSAGIAHGRARREAGAETSRTDAEKHTVAGAQVPDYTREPADDERTEAAPAHEPMPYNEVTPICPPVTEDDYSM